MARIRYGFVVLLSAVMLTAGAAAQSNEIAGAIGRTFISDQGVPGAALADSNIHYGDALSYEVNYAHRFVNIGVASLAVEVPFVFTFNQKLNYTLNQVPKDFNSFFLTPSARISFFPASGFSPWISGGGGFGRFSESSTLEFGGPNPGPSSNTVGAVQLGLGLDVRLLRSVRLRGEVRDFYSGQPDLNINPQVRRHNLFAGIGLAWHF
jgi:opacity protein-like surface antigen